MATRLPQRGLTAPGLVFHWDSVPAPDAPRGLFNPPDPLSKGVIRAYGLSIAYGFSLPASSGPSSDDALLILRSVLFRYVVRLLPQTTTMCAAFASSMYLLPQRRQNRLFCLRRWIHVCKYGLSAHVMQFLKGHGGKSGLFATVVLH